jgi:hypothetical protein
VADKVRKREFETKLSAEAFKPVSKRVLFWSYDDVAELHSKTTELSAIESKLGPKI